MDNNSNSVVPKLYTNKALSNTKQEVRQGNTMIHGWNIQNPNAAASYVQFFNKLAANVTVGSTVNDYSLLIAANSSVYTDRNRPLNFGTGFTVAATTTEAGSTAPVSALVVNIDYR